MVVGGAAIGDDLSDVEDGGPVEAAAVEEGREVRGQCGGFDAGQGGEGGQEYGLLHGEVGGQVRLDALGDGLRAVRVVGTGEGVDVLVERGRGGA
ncbi:hypothetical protein ACFWII_22895 [Streptomyces sp. NPDC127063]|uniref:hypothetical protein n=1 Tax=Streptomyces sp. NPDC127063 TaxID=3347123 RepID=UPI0036655CDD